MTKAIEKICTVSGADIRAVLYALVDVAVDSLADGTIVRLGDLGSLRITLSSEGKDKPEDINASAIKEAGVIFTPGTRIKEMLLSAKFEKVS
jgi:predicted histone-like DNA-binding protein